MNCDGGFTVTWYLVLKVSKDGKQKLLGQYKKVSVLHVRCFDSTTKESDSRRRNRSRTAIKDWRHRHPKNGCGNGWLIFGIRFDVGIGRRGIPFPHRPPTLASSRRFLMAANEQAGHFNPSSTANYDHGSGAALTRPNENYRFDGINSSPMGTQSSFFGKTYL